MSPYHSATTLLSSYLRLQLSQELAVHGPQDASAQRALQVRLVGEVPVDDRLRGARGGGDVLHRHVGATGVDQVPSHVQQFGTALLAVLGPAGRAAVDGGLRRRIHGTYGIKYRRFYVKSVP